MGLIESIFRSRFGDFPRPVGDFKRKKCDATDTPAPVNCDGADTPCRSQSATLPTRRLGKLSTGCWNHAGVFPALALRQVPVDHCSIQPDSRANIGQCIMGILPAQFDAKVIT